MSQCVVIGVAHCDLLERNVPELCLLLVALCQPGGEVTMLGTNPSPSGSRPRL
jgi:hypothetical protein